MDTAVVAGGAGFIGSHLVRALLAKGNRVICVDNEITGSVENIKDLQNNPQFVYKKKNIIDSDVAEIFGQEEIGYIYHLASPASPNNKSPRSYMQLPLETMMVNSLGTYNLLEIAKKKNSKFLFASTSEVYGDPTVSPQPESYFGNVNPNGPRSVYDEAKRFGEAMVASYVRQGLVDARIIRIFNTYGSSMQVDDGRVVSNFISQALTGKPLTIYGNGTQTRSFCYVDDMVLGIEKAMISANTKGEVINLGNPDEKKISELAIIIKELVGSKSEIEYEPLSEDDPTQRKPSIEKAKKLLDWEPSVSLREGLEKTIEYFKIVV